MVAEALEWVQESRSERSQESKASKKKKAKAKKKLYPALGDWRNPSSESSSDVGTGDGLGGANS